MKQRGLILPVVLFILLMVGMLGAMFAFRIHADAAALRAYTQRMQSRLAAEAGVERVKLMLRYARYDQQRWYDNPEELHRIVVWGHELDPLTWGTNEEFEEGDMIYRFSIVADNPSFDEDIVRFGLTDESSKLNLNLATREQLLKLVRAAVEDERETIPEEIVDAIIDWRDKDSTPSGEATDTEGEYYLSLDRPYLIKNGPFDTVEELLLVKGMNGLILYGEDQDRNGLLTENEDDGDRSFPPDNQDGRLNRGLWPYLTVLSYETNVDNANRPRIYLHSDAELLSQELEEVFPGETEVINFIVDVTRQQPGGPGQGNNPPQGGNGPGGQNNNPPGQDDQGDAGNNAGNNPDPTGGSNPLDEKPPPEKASDGFQDNPNAGRGGQPAPQPPGGRQPGSGNQPTGGQPGPTGGNPNPPSGGESNGGNDNNRPIRSPASLLLDRTAGGQPKPSPLTLDHLPILMDRFTIHKPDVRKIKGLINVNTATRTVLDCIEGLTPEQVDAVLEARRALTPEMRRTTAWLVTSGAIDLETYEQIAPSITARGQQFRIESLGYGDHVGMVTRLEVVVDMVGPIAHTIYYRDLTEVGVAYPIREKDLEQAIGR
jgi:type II secretory pathway component PulK